MADITRPLNDLLIRQKASLRQSPRQRSALQDEFLKEAYRINDHVLRLKSYLLSIRRAYLSTAPPPRRSQRNQIPNTPSPQPPSYLGNKEKDSIDASSKTILRDLSASLTQLASAESVRRETSARVLTTKYSKGILGRWAAGAGATEKSAEQSAEEGKLETLKVVRESVIWYLTRKLEEVGEVQRGMMERRLEREVERGRSVLYKSRPMGLDSPTSPTFGAAQMNGHAPEERAQRERASEVEMGVAVEDDRTKLEQQLSPDQLQLFAQENQDMQKQYEDTLDQVRTAERGMLEISELQTQLVQNLDVQSANISQLVADSLSTTENIGSGNKQLKRAAERRSRAQMVFWATCGLCGFLVTWDLIF